MQWNTFINSTCGTRQLYRFSYDAANRLTAAAHRTWSGSAWTDPARYNESNIAYDLNGNLKTYTRQGLTSGTSTFGTIDNLTYTYSISIPDRLIAMADAGNITKGFKYKNSIIGDHYLYDANGNLTEDKHKDLFFAYNHLNLPNSINNLADDYIILTYTADGEKLTKVAGGVTKNYVSGIEYTGANLEAIYHTEGRCTPNGSTFYYEYTLKDHLGNARVNWRANGTAVIFLEELHYYPFGMLMEGIGTAPVTTNGYKYNSKELNADLGLNWYDYGARWYDPAVGRWWSVDPMAEKTKQWSPNNYTYNNPLKFIDPDGRTGEPYIKGNTITIKSDFIFYGNVNDKKTQNDIKKDAKRAEKAWNEAGKSGKINIDGKEYSVKYKFSVKFDTKSKSLEESRDANGSGNGKSHIEVGDGKGSRTEDTGGSGYLNKNDILNESRTFTHEYGHENGWDAEEGFNIHDSKGYSGENGKKPGIMTARETPCGEFDSNYCTDGLVNADKRLNPQLRDIDRTINNGRELLLEKIRAKIND